MLNDKFKIITIGLIIILGVLIIEEKCIYSNDKFNIQSEEYEIKDLASLIGKNKEYINDILNEKSEKEILNKKAHIDVYFDEEKEIASLININFKEENKSTYKVISENLWNELGKSSLKYIASDENVTEIWYKGNLEINFNKVNDCISVKIN